MPMKHPPHPGHSIKDACLEPLGLTVTTGAEVLNVSRSQLSKVINGKAAISPEMAIRLSKAFGSTPRAWLKMQWAYDPAQAEQNAHQIRIKRYTSSHGPDEART